MATENGIPPWITESMTPEDLKGVDSQIKQRGYSPAIQRSGDTIYTVQGYIIRESEKAILIEVRQINDAPIDEADIPGNKRDQWFPLSQVKSITRATRDGESAIEYDNIQVKQWILSSKGLI